MMADDCIATQDRGVGIDDDIVAKFRIGYAPDSGFLLRDRLAHQFSDDILRQSGLFSWKTEEKSRSLDFAGQSGSGFRGSAGDDRPGVEKTGQRQEEQIPPGLKPRPYDNLGRGESKNKAASSPLAMYSKFRNRVMFPITNDSGKVIAFTGRTLSTDEKAGPKYLNSPETPIYSKSRVLFNLDQAKEAIRQLNYAILVEGQMDCISVFAAGFHNVIASSGTAFTDAQAKLLGRVFAEQFEVNADGAALARNKQELSSERVQNPHDPDATYAAKGQGAAGSEANLG